MKIFNTRFFLCLILFLSLFLRIYKINEVPVSLFGDELDLGYHAYSILKTGNDYTGHFLPLNFKSLAEWRTPLYLYSSVPTVVLFGITPLGVRLPAVLFGFLSVFVFYLLVKEFTKKEGIALVACFLLTISPWHIQYSRAGFEVTELLFFYLLGLLLFLKGLHSKKLLIFSAISFALTPLIYNTAKLYLPVTLVAIFLIWRNMILKLPKRIIVISSVAFLTIIIPFTISMLFNGGLQRFNDISVFNDSNYINKVEESRNKDYSFENKKEVLTKILYNKYSYLSSQILNNYLSSFSSQFLFIQGDINLRHSILGYGEFYQFEFIFLLLGIVFLFTRPIDLKVRTFIVFWLLSAPIPTSLTQQGVDHATRLFLMLPPLILLIAIGMYYSFQALNLFYKKMFISGLGFLIFLSFFMYLHNYFIQYPWDSERWWQAGYEDMIHAAVKNKDVYKKVIINSSNEPPLIFLLGWSQYPPERFQEVYPLKKEMVGKFGYLNKLDNFYFGDGKVIPLYDLETFLDSDTLYIADQKEAGWDLVEMPFKVPSTLILKETIKYPSGKPAFYLLTKKK